MKITFNKNRLDYLLSLYKLTQDDLLSMINEGLKKSITLEDISSSKIEVNHLKRIDKIFNKGLYYYSDPNTPTKNNDISIFFRKPTFGTELNIGAKKRVREFEDLEIHINALCQLSGLNLKPLLKTYEVDEDPKKVAFDLRNTVLPDFNRNKREFLKAFINKLGEFNILVFEFVETFNLKTKANIDGFYIGPNVIVIKRNQESFSREIFTLSHELGHYLLQHEEIESVNVEQFANNKNIQSDVEKWCNTFAFNLLLGEIYNKELSTIEVFDNHNDYGHELVQRIADNTNLSRLAIFTNLYLDKKLSQTSYVNIKNELSEQMEQRKNEIRIHEEISTTASKTQKGSSPKPITSSLVSDILDFALHIGTINEMEYSTMLKPRY